MVCYGSPINRNVSRCCRKYYHNLKLYFFQNICDWLWPWIFFARLILGLIDRRDSVCWYSESQSYCPGIFSAKVQDNFFSDWKKFQLNDCRLFLWLKSTAAFRNHSCKVARAQQNGLSLLSKKRILHESIQSWPFNVNECRFHSIST